MASFVTHMVIGEQVFAELPGFDPADYGAFLLGCVLVDVHAFYDVDQRTTHFAERFDERGVDAFNRSCSNFLTQLDSLLVRPWRKLTSAERAFIAGYLCHLAADEEEAALRLLRDLEASQTADDVVMRWLALRYRRMCESLLQRRKGGVLRKPPKELLPKLRRWMQRSIDLRPDRYAPVSEPFARSRLLGVPVCTIEPPATPAPGPKSIT